MLKQITISELVPGMMVTRVLEQHGPVKIRRVGLIKSVEMVKGLKEMGVNTLEIDSAQTIRIEDEPAVSNESKPTPTQKLMAEAKSTIAPNQPSAQNFHRSLFMPSVDEMPSKWRLYVRPYALLGASAAAGFVLGYLIISIPLFLFNALSGQQADIVNNTQTQPAISSSTQDVLGSQPNSLPSPQPSPQPNSDGYSPEKPAEQGQSDAQPTDVVVRLESDSSRGNASQQSSTQESSTQQSSSQQSASEQSPPQSSTTQQASTAQNTQVSTDTPKETTTKRIVNGVELNEGETLLGYQGEALTNQSTSGSAIAGNIAGNSPGQTQLEQNGSALSFELLNRVNRVAAQLESEQDSSEQDSSQQDSSQQDRSQQDRSQQVALQNTSNSANRLPNDQESSPSPLDLTRLLNASRPPTGPVIDLRSQPKPNQTANPSQSTVMQRIDQLPPALLTQMPAMSFSAHMYASNPRDRWVRVNGQRMLEGNTIADDLNIVEIQAEKVILSFKGEQFSMNALSDW